MDNNVRDRIKAKLNEGLSISQIEGVLNQMVHDYATTPTGILGKLHTMYANQGVRADDIFAAIGRVMAKFNKVGQYGNF